MELIHSQISQKIPLDCSNKIHSILLIRNRKKLFRKELNQIWAQMNLLANKLIGLDLMTTGPSQLACINATWLHHYSQGTIIAATTKGTRTNTIKYFFETHRKQFLSIRGRKMQSKVFITRLNRTLRMKMKTLNPWLKLLKKMILFNLSWLTYNLRNEGTKKFLLSAQPQDKWVAS